jgi:ligand-binding SRPBCC domain-containing protein
MDSCDSDLNVGKMEKLYRRQKVFSPLHEVFAFFERPENLERLTPASLRFEILTPSPIPMEQGALIDYRIRLAGIPFRWTTYIAQYHPPHHFVDIQLRGPYSFWHHTHRFTSVEGGHATLIEDEVCYCLPFGLIGTVAHRIWIRSQLARIFDYRARVIADLFSPSNQLSSLAPTCRYSQR